MYNVFSVLKRFLARQMIVNIYLSCQKQYGESQFTVYSLNFGLTKAFSENLFSNKAP